MFDFLLALVAVAANSAAVDAPASETAQAPAPAVQQAPAAEVAEAPQETAPVANPSVIIGDSAVIGEGVIVGGSALLNGTNETGQTTQPTAQTPAAPAGVSINQAVIPAGLVAEPQTPSGKFTTATEVKPILNATKGSWVAVREYDGKDLLYVTHLWAWRCGLAAMAISVNDEPMQNWPLPPCHLKYATPNAILDDDGLPYLSLKLGAVQKITIQIVYDDLSTDVASFERGNVLIP